MTTTSAVNIDIATLYELVDALGFASLQMNKGALSEAAHQLATFASGHGHTFCIAWCEYMRGGLLAQHANNTQNPAARRWRLKQAEGAYEACIRALEQNWRHEH